MKNNRTLLAVTVFGLSVFFALRIIKPDTRTQTPHSPKATVIEGKPTANQKAQPPNTHGEALKNNLEKIEETGQNQFLGKDLESFESPSIETYRNEVEADPHSTPSSLLDFARDLTPHIERGLTVKSYAPTVMEFLEKCALSETTPTAAKASCLVNAGRLRSAHPEIFKDRFENLKQNVSAHTLKIAKGIGLKE